MDDCNLDRRFERLGSLPVRLSARVCGRKLKLDEFLEWVPGTVLLFEQAASDPLQLHVDEKQIGEGQAVKTGQHFGLRIQRIGHAK